MIETAHEAVPGAAHLRAFEGVAAGRVGTENQRGFTSPALRNDHVRIGTDDAEPMVGVVAPQPELDHGPALHLDLRRREREPLRRHPDHLCDPARIRTARRARRGARHPRASCGGRAWCGHQNHQPSPMFRLSTLLNSELLVPDHRVVDLEHDVGIGKIRRADDPGGAIELLQRQHALGHAELRVEVFVAHEQRRSRTAAPAAAAVTARCRSRASAPRCSGSRRSSAAADRSAPPRRR